jgi:hypothetical protein
MYRDEETRRRPGSYMFVSHTSPYSHITLTP